MSLVKTVVITGATGGLGQALVEQFAQVNYRLILVGRHEEKLKSLVCKWESACHSIVYIVCDFVREIAREQLIEQLTQENIDIFIHNAGYGEFAHAQEFTYQAVNDMLQVNLLAPIQITNALLPVFYARQTGQIIFVASQASKMATPKSSIYSASKFGLRGYANSIRLEAKEYHIHVTTVNPGPIATNFFKRADKTGQYVKAVEKYMLSGQKVAKRIYANTHNPKREINLPYVMEIMAKSYVLFPQIADYLARRLFNKK